jgi:hypothetical protein
MERRAKKSPAKQLLNFFEVRQFKVLVKQLFPENHNFAEHDGLADKVTIAEYNKPRSWRITLPTQENEIFEEVIVRIQGIVCNKHLPPVLTIPR